VAEDFWTNLLEYLDILFIDVMAVFNSGRLLQVFFTILLILPKVGDDAPLMKDPDHERCMEGVNEEGLIVFKCMDGDDKDMAIDDLTTTYTPFATIIDQKGDIGKLSDRGEKDYFDSEEDDEITQLSSDRS